MNNSWKILAVALLSFVSFAVVHLHRQDEPAAGPPAKPTGKVPVAVADPDSLGLANIDIPAGELSLGCDDRITLRQTLPPGRYTLYVMSHSTLRAEDAEFKGKALGKEKDYWYELDVSPADERAHQRITFRTSRAKYYRSDIGRRLDTDDPASLEGDPAGKMLLVGMKFPLVLTVDGKGQCLSLSGMEKFIEAAATEPAVAAFMARSQGATGPGMSKVCFSIRWLMPSEPVGLGAIWQAEDTTSIPDMLKTQLTARCRLIELEQVGVEMLATVEYVATDTSLVQPASLAGLSVMDEETEAVTHIKGRFVVNVQSGLLVEHAELHHRRGPQRSFGREFTMQLVRTKRTEITPLE